MTNNGTGLAVKMMIVFAVTALFLFYIAGTQRHIREPDMGWVLGAILLMSVLLMQVFFFKFSENRRPIGFFLVFIGLIILPGCAFLITQVVFGIRLELEGPNSPSPLILVPYLVFVAIVFFRMATWALTFTPAPGSSPVSTDSLRQRMLAMNNAREFPFIIKPGKRNNQLIMDWKYADATWFDLMRIHRIAYLTRFTIWVDESDHVVRVREYQSQFDGSGSPSSLNLQFKAQWGIDFYNFRYETVYGVQVENGMPVPKPSYTYKFDIKEMREPLQKLVVENGWTYKGVVVFAKWLTG